MKIENIQDLPEDIEYFNNNLYDTIYIKYSDKFTTYGNCLLNKWCGFNHIILNKLISKKEANEISRWIYKNQNKNKEKFYNQINKLNKLLFSFITITNHCPSLNIIDMVNLLDEETEKLFKNIPKDYVNIGYHINEALIDRCLNNFNHDSSLYKLFKSGSRFSKTQLARSCINIGYVSDDKNIVVSTPINSNLLKGLTEKDFFLGSPGSRKSIADKSVHTPQSGYLERTLVMGMSILEIVEEDCCTEHYIETIISSKNHAKTLSDKYYRDPQKNMDWEILDYRTAVSLINKKIYLRSPITCETPNLRLCKKCFGERKFNTQYIGIVAGTNLTERLTQLILRVFHTSGSAELKIDKLIKDFLQRNLYDIKYNNNQLILYCKNIKDIPKENFKNLKEYENIVNNKIILNKNKENIKNKDMIALLTQIKNVLKRSENVSKKPQEYYNELMELILSVGTIYSSFVEMLFANIFLVDVEKRRFWRYFQDEDIKLKLGDKNVAKFISNLLGLLYEPNKNSIENMEETFKNIVFDPKKHSIHERIWLNEL